MNDRVVKDIALIASLLDGKVKFNKLYGVKFYLVNRVKV